nr:ABC transporter permease [Sphaerisporangium rufum]
MTGAGERRSGHADPPGDPDAPAPGTAATPADGIPDGRVAGTAAGTADGSVDGSVDGTAAEIAAGGTSGTAAGPAGVTGETARQDGASRLDGPAGPGAPTRDGTVQDGAVQDGPARADGTTREDGGAREGGTAGAADAAPPATRRRPAGTEGSSFTDRLLGRVHLGGLLGLAAPLLAIAFAALITSVVLLLTGSAPLETLALLVDFGTQPRTIVMIVNLATTYYISALAVAVGFRMNLFNIGVDGQYRLAALVAAAVGGTLVLPGPLHVGATVLVAVIVGGVWASIAGLLKVTRGVSEVISTIMLNAIATGIGAWLLHPDRLAVPVSGSNNIGTRPIPASGQFPGLALVPGTQAKVFGFVIVAAVLGLAYYVLFNRTRLGFDMRATGRSESAAVASGVNVRKMVLTTMIISGAVAGLVGMPQLLGASYSYSLDFPTGLGFTGIAIALLGRNNPAGIAVGALLWSFLDSSSDILDFNGIPKEIVIIMQGTTVLSVIIAYELVHRYRMAAQQRRVSRQLSAGAAPVEGATA